MADPVFGKGIQIKRATSTTVGATAFVKIPAFKGTLSGPGGTSDVKDVTTHDTVGRLRAKAAGLADFDTLDGQLQFDPDDTVHKLVLADWVSGDFRDYQLILPAGVSQEYGFRGQVSRFKQQYPMDDYVMCDLSFTILTFDFDA